ncbi:zinc finger, CCHC-type containing protein [Tanacetum coccineum]
MWIWHEYFGVPGANNDLNVLYGSLLFCDLLADKAAEAPFVVNGKTYNKGYYLDDGIYTTWSTFVKTYCIARDEKTIKFKRVKESSRKNIERAFGFGPSPSANASTSDTAVLDTAVSDDVIFQETYPLQRIEKDNGEGE